jgi:ABC-type transport system involved in multi-copper enzyme maturation permease subunit
MFTPQVFRQIFVLAADEFRELLLRRRAFLSLLIYVAVVVGSLWAIFRVQRVFGFNMVHPPNAEAYQRLLEKMNEIGLGDTFAIFMKLTQFPEMLWIFQLFSVLWFPTLVALVSCDAVAVDIYRGTLRFILLRSSRLAYYLGKFVAHFGLYFILQLASLSAVWILTYAFYPDEDLGRLTKLTIYYVLVFVPFLAWLVALTQLVSSWSRRPMSALVRVHVLWVVLIVVASQVPQFTPLDGDLVFGLFAPFDAYPISTVVGYSLWTLVFLVVGLFGFIKRDV